MKTILLCVALGLALQASDCATAGSIQDSSVTKAKRDADAEDMAKATPTPYTKPKMPKRPGGAPEVAER